MTASVTAVTKVMRELAADTTNEVEEIMHARVQAAAASSNELIELLGMAETGDVFQLQRCHSLLRGDITSTDIGEVVKICEEFMQRLHQSNTMRVNYKQEEVRLLDQTLMMYRALVVKHNDYVKQKKKLKGTIEELEKEVASCVEANSITAECKRVAEMKTREVNPKP